MAGDVVCVVGPTASGKSDLAIDLALRLPAAEVVNADAMQLYCGMDIGTAKVRLGERRGVRHHLLDVLDIGESASVAEFQTMARAAIADCLARGVTPIVVGGSALYVRAVVDRLDFPGTDPRVRERWAARLDQIGPAALHTELAARDPAAAAVILPSNGRRIVRAMEVIDLTGKPFAARLPGHESVYPSLAMLGLDVPRDTLDEQIAARVDRMWAAGFVDEVRGLDLAGTPTASRAIGYRQVTAFLRGEQTEAEAREQTTVATRKFARRQDRMFRQDPRVRWLPAGSPTLVDDAVAAIG